MEDDYCMVRIRKSTRRRLRQENVHLVERYEQGLTGGLPADAERINPAGTGLSMDRLILYLLDLVQGHRERARKASAKRRNKRPS
jgi:hypothetical protein